VSLLLSRLCSQRMPCHHDALPSVGSTNNQESLDSAPPRSMSRPACPVGGPPTEVMRGGQQANEAGRHREPGEGWQMGRLRRLSHQSSPTACTATLRRLPTMLGRANDGEPQPPICHPAWAIRAAPLPSYPFRPWGIRASCLFLKHS
jgi:hypothetical protein